ncbi:MAG: pyridoxamine 5'-phosphate oxidase family protein [Candidatus Hodarchaeales archaeon]
MKKLVDFSNILDKKSFLHLAIVKKNGLPHVSPIWFSDDRENGILFINTATGRVKTFLDVGSRVAGSILDPDNAYSYLGFEGTVTDRIMGEEADSHIDQLAKRYLGQDKYPYRKSDEKRIKLTVKVDFVSGRQR